MSHNLAPDDLKEWSGTVVLLCDPLMTKKGFRKVFMKIANLLIASL